MDRPRTRTAVLLIALAMGAPAVSQAPAAPKPVAGPPPEAPRPASTLPVLREGVMLTSTRGYFARSLREPGLLVFRLEERLASSGRRPILVMPCDPAEDIKAILADPREDSPVRFEVTGEIFDGGDRAFLLPMAIVALRPPTPPGMLARTAPKELERPDPARPAPRAPRIDAYAEDVGAAAAATPAREAPPDRLAHEPDTTLFPGFDDGLADELERRLDQGIARSGLGTAVKRAVEAHDRTALVPTATRILSRRATVLRDPLTGAWRARFATGREDAGTGVAPEASMEILPSRTLTELERKVRERPIGTTWLLSGEVVNARDRSYLVLTRAVEPPVSRFESP
jgi:hypothetical protein